MSWYLADYTPADRKDLPALSWRVKAALDSRRVLLLMNENYEGSIEALAEFLGASFLEKQAMLARSQQSVNHAPQDYSIALHKSTWDMLNEDLAPLELVYDLVQLNSGLAKGAHSRVSSEVADDMVQLTVKVDGYDAEP